MRRSTKLGKTVGWICLWSFTFGTFSPFIAGPSEAALLIETKTKDEKLPETTKTPRLFNLERRNQQEKTSEASGKDKEGKSHKDGFTFHKDGTWSWSGTFAFNGTFDAAKLIKWLLEFLEELKKRQKEMKEMEDRRIGR